MTIGVIQASSQTNKNSILFDAVKEYAVGHEIVNFGCFPDESITYSYIDMSLEIGILLASKAVDFITLLERMDHALLTKALQRNNMVDYVLKHGMDTAVVNWIKLHI